METLCWKLEGICWIGLDKPNSPKKASPLAPHRRPVRHRHKQEGRRLSQFAPNIQQPSKSSGSPCQSTVFLLFLFLDHC